MESAIAQNQGAVEDGVSGGSLDYLGHCTFSAFQTALVILRVELTS
jgi:hypothetical protein